MYFAKCLCVAYYKPAKEQGDHSELKFIIFCFYNYNYVITVQHTMSQQKSKVIIINLNLLFSVFISLCHPCVAYYKPAKGQGE